MQENSDTKEWTPEWTEGGLNIHKMDHELWSYYRRLQRNLQSQNRVQDPFGFVEGIISSLTASLPNNESEFLGQINDIMASKVLELAMPLANEKQIRFLFSKFNNRFFLLATGKFSSFLLQKIMSALALIYVNELGQEFPEKDDVPKAVDMVNKMLNELSDKWADLIHHSFGTHILRAIIQLLVKIENFEQLEIVISQLLDKVEAQDWFHNPLVAPVLVMLLEVTKDNYLNARLLKMVIDQLDDSDKVMSALNSTTSSRVIDACIKSCNEKMVIKLYKKVWKKNIKKISVSYTGNYSLSFLLRRLPQKYFEQAFDKLQEIFDEIFKSTRGVLVTIIELCAQYKTKQEEFLASFKILDMEDFIHQVIEVGDKFDRIGCNLVKDLAKFDNTEKLCQRFTSFARVKELAFDKSGSLLVEAMIPLIPTEIFGLLSNQLVELSMNCYGCRVLQTLYTHINVDLKVELIKSLLLKPEIKESKFGKICWENCQVAEFKKMNNVKKWKEEQGRQDKRKRDFGEILTTENPSKTSNPSKKKKFENKNTDQSTGDLSFIFNAIKGSK